MFFLWGILIASPIVALILLAFIWFTHLLLVPLAAGQSQRLEWNRPSFSLAVITTMVALGVSALSIYNAVTRTIPEEILLMAMNISATLLTASVLVVAIELLGRRAISALGTVIAAVVFLLIGSLVTLIVFPW